MGEKIKQAFTTPNFNDMIKFIYDLKDEIIRLKNENDSLKAQLKTDSHNSSKPLSSDGLAKKNINLRKSSIKSVSGQVGHKGNTLKFEGKADKIVHHVQFENCSRNFSEV